MSLVLLPGSEHGVGREFFICADAAFVHLAPVVQRLDNAIQRISVDKTNHAIHWIVIYPVDSVIQLLNNRGLDVLIRFYRVPTKMNRNSVCPRQVSNFCGLDKSTISPVYLMLSTTLYRPS